MTPSLSSKCQNRAKQEDPRDVREFMLKQKEEHKKNIINASTAEELMTMKIDYKIEQ